MGGLDEQLDALGVEVERYGGEIMKFTAVGRAVNEASRIETLCDATGRHILMSDGFAPRCGGDLIDLGTFPLRGIAAPQRIWTGAEG